MGIPNVKRFRLTNSATGQQATVMAVLPKGADQDAYIADASKRFDWKRVFTSSSPRATRRSAETTSGVG